MDVFQTVRRIEITTRKLMNEVLSGNYRSHFKGQGMQFSEHRIYNPGDDIRHIDWKVSARSKEPLIKRYEEERELTVLLVVDVSASNAFGSLEKTKIEMNAELAAIIAFAATQGGDRCGAVLFSDRIEALIPPKKGKTHAMRIVRELLDPAPREGTGTNLALALETAGHLMKHIGVIFIISDFLASGYEPVLKRLARRHDVVAVGTEDPRENEVPSAGMLLLRDPETGEEAWVDTSSYAFREWLKLDARKREAQKDAAFRGNRVERIRARTDQDYREALVRFFLSRSRAQARRRIR